LLERRKAKYSSRPVIEEMSEIVFAVAVEVCLMVLVLELDTS
jgi:hypothetical protein